MKPVLRLSLLSIALVSALLAPACKKKTADGATQLADDKSSVCIVNGLGVRATPSKTGKTLASLSLGESVKWLGGNEKDEGGRDYLKVALSDGQEGWVTASGLVTGAKVGAIMDDAVLYKRPDPLTATTQKVACMSIVAVIQEKDGWLQLVGEGHRSLGWAAKGSLTLDKGEVTTAILATKKLREKDGLDREAKIEAIARTAPNPDSAFIQKLRDRAAASAAPIAISGSGSGGESAAPKTE